METIARKPPVVFNPVSPHAGMPDRPFTDPTLAQSDFDTLAQMLSRVEELLQAHPELRRTRSPFRTVLTENDRPHQVIIARPGDLRTRLQFTVVGFFGTMQPGAEEVTLQAVKAVDEELIGEFPRFGGLLSYNSKQLPTGDWGNMAVFKDMATMERWNRNAIHANAIRQLAALHYKSIRLHVVDLTGGLSGGQLQPVRTKYYEFDPKQGSMWRGLAMRNGS
ncbi:MAG TPA: hypothetical protein VGO93_02935 [Candidatus Xenobia bacterium]|jgi:hypothetical protein